MATIPVSSPSPGVASAPGAGGWTMSDQPPDQPQPQDPLAEPRWQQPDQPQQPLRRRNRTHRGGSPRSPHSRRHGATGTREALGPAAKAAGETDGSSSPLPSAASCSWQRSPSPSACSSRPPSARPRRRSPARRRSPPAPSVDQPRPAPSRLRKPRRRPRHRPATRSSRSVRLRSPNTPTDCVSR